MHECVIFVRQFQKIRNTYPETFVPRGFGGGTFPTPSASRSSPLKAWRSRGQGVFSKPLRCNFPEVKSRDTWNGVLFMFPLGIHGTDIYIYICISTDPWRNQQMVGSLFWYIISQCIFWGETKNKTPWQKKKPEEWETLQPGRLYFSYFSEETCVCFLRFFKILSHGIHHHEKTLLGEYVSFFEPLKQINRRNYMVLILMSWKLLGWTFFFCLLRSKGSLLHRAKGW